MISGIQTPQYHQNEKKLYFLKNIKSCIDKYNNKYLF